MVGFPSPFGGESGRNEDLFDPSEEFLPESVPSPGEFLTGHDVLTGQEHVECHAVAKEVFEVRGVYDMTFGYNLAKLNHDTRHPNAGFRYARQAGDPDVLRAEFTPTTPFCPQSDTLTKGAFRAWNGLSNDHEYRLVRVRVDRSHQQSETINESLEALESSGDPGEADGSEQTTERVEARDGAEVGTSSTFRGTQGSDPDAPF